MPQHADTKADMTHPRENPRAADCAVLLDNVVFAWPGQQREILRIPYLAVPRGEHVFISGPSGSGKSTLLSLVAGILRPSSGQVFVNGVCLTPLSGSARDAFRGDGIGFIFQQFNLVPYLSVLDNVLIPCRLSAARSRAAAVRFTSPEHAASHLLERLGLEPSLWRSKASRLSVGQQQRVAAARALIGSPPLLVADEPTSALDTDLRQDFLRLLLRECAESGAGLLFVSHDQTLAEKFPRQLRLTELNTAGTRGEQA